MSFEADRWQSAPAMTSSTNLAERWQITTRQWLQAQAEYRALYDAEITNVSALRKAAQRLHDLAQLRKVLANSMG